LRDRARSIHQRHAEMLEWAAITDERPSRGGRDVGPTRALRDPRSGHKRGSRLIQVLALRWAGAPLVKAGDHISFTTYAICSNGPNVEADGPANADQARSLSM
jgi:hypothetical protein